MVGRRLRSLAQSLTCNNGCRLLEADPREIGFVQVHPDVSITKIFVTRSGQHNNCPRQDNSIPLFSPTRARHRSWSLTCLRRRSANRRILGPSLMTSEHGRWSQSRASSIRNALLDMQAVRVDDHPLALPKSTTETIRTANASCFLNFQD
jgi:hypothetical protein